MSVNPSIDLSTRDISLIARIDQPQQTNLRMSLTDENGKTLSLMSEYHRNLHPTGWLTFTPSVIEAEADLSSIDKILISVDGVIKPLYTGSMRFSFHSGLTKLHNLYLHSMTIHEIYTKHSTQSCENLTILVQSRSLLIRLTHRRVLVLKKWMSSLNPVGALIIMLITYRLCMDYQKLTSG